MDLKCHPSKQRLAAEKYKSRFATKPTHLPRPVCCKASSTTTTSATNNPNPIPVSTSVADKEGEKNQTLPTPATSNKMRDAIEALLMLGDAPPTDSQLALDDNALLVPIAGSSTASIPPPAKEDTDNLNIEATDEPIPSVDTPLNNDGAEAPVLPQQPPLPRTVLGMAVKTDLDNTDQNTIKLDPAPKKELSFKQYGIKRKYKSARKFKCKICLIELPSIQEFNQHYLDKHPPLLCPDCTKVFSSPRTLAKHRYTHAEFMFEYQDCG